MKMSVDAASIVMGSGNYNKKLTENPINEKGVIGSK